MSQKKGFAPIILATVIAGSVLVLGGGGAGIAYCKSNKLIELGKSKTIDGKFVDARDAYAKASKWWPSKYRKKLADTGKQNVISDEKYQKAVAAAGSGNFVDCVANLEDIKSEYPKYQYVESVLRQCQGNQNRVISGQAPAEMVIAGQPAATAGQTSGSSKSVDSAGSAVSSQNTDSIPAAVSPSSENQTGTDSTNNGNSGAISQGNSSSNGTSPNVGLTIPTTQPNQPVTSQTIHGDYSTTSVETIISSLQLAYDDATGDFVTPPGGAPPAGVYHYDPIDVDNVYLGIHEGRIYIKLTLAGTIPNPQDVIDGDKIKSLTYNINLNQHGHTATDCGDGVSFQAIIEYHDDGTIWYSPHFWANCLSGTSEHDMVYEAYDTGTVHTYNSGLGKSTLVFSYALSDIAGTVAAGTDYDVSIYSEAESTAWHHYSFENDMTAWNEAITSLWTAAEI